MSNAPAVDASENEFDRVIREIDRLETDPDRHLSIQLDAEIRACIRAARASASKATLVLTLTVTPSPERRVIFRAKHKSTLPKPAAAAVTLYADDAGGIHNHDPAQLPIPHTSRPRAVDKD